MSSSYASLPLTVFPTPEQPFLVHAVDALKLSATGSFQRLPRYQTAALVGRLGRSDAIRAFIARIRPMGIVLNRLREGDLRALLCRMIDSGDLVAVRPSGPSTNADKASVEQRSLVRAIEARTRGKMLEAGRQHKLVVGEDLPSLPDRDCYEVVRHAEAIRILQAVAHRAGPADGEQSELLAKAREKLAKDWRLPFGPEGLVLLRRIPSLPGYQREEVETFSPSALKKLRDEGWIEIVFVDAGMEPIANASYDVRLADGQVKTGKTDKNGSARFEAITPGECVVKFPNAKGPVVLS